MSSKSEDLVFFPAKRDQCRFQVCYLTKPKRSLSGQTRELFAHAQYLEQLQRLQSIAEHQGQAQCQQLYALRPALLEFEVQ